ncbi:uncharacterized protein LOC128258425 [Drosophila gunungcola]|uniref:uncharacterized protein LOC128258425 n=1 Tax=Drosophila gunungcola TaxID=103775 RepID=UPI0022E82A1F|nr:uncharacterized protein LOC128258425 [Drosophila gunungcola]
MESPILHNLKKIEEFKQFDVTYFLIIYACVVLMVLGVPLAILLQSKDSPNERNRYQLEANRSRDDQRRGGVARRRILDSNA